MVTIYTQDGCAPCNMVKRYFDHFGAKYQLKQRDEYAEEMLSIAGTITTPVITDGSSVVVGYNPKELSEML